MDRFIGYFYHADLQLELTLVSSSTHLLKIEFGKVQITNGNEQHPPIIVQTKQQLSEYFAGKRKRFSVKLNPAGTVFQQHVWQTLQTIPFGETTSYGDIATAIGNPKAARAIGMANNRNPIPIIIPCHRIIGRNGSLTGYAGGLPLKQALLTLEQQHEQ